MGKPFYRKIVQGYIEQVYDEEGNCLSQEFFPHESAPVDRRIIRGEDENVTDGELEDDEVIEHPEDIAALESVEKFCGTDLVQPKPPKKPVKK
jgi:hypothetical protein